MKQTRRPAPESYEYRMVVLVLRSAQAMLRNMPLKLLERFRKSRQAYHRSWVQLKIIGFHKKRQ